MSKQYQDLDTGEFHWTDEYVEGLEATIQQVRDLLCGDGDCFCCDELQALIGDKECS